MQGRQDQLQFSIQIRAVKSIKCTQNKRTQNLSKESFVLRQDENDLEYLTLVHNPEKKRKKKTSIPLHQTKKIYADLGLRVLVAHFVPWTVLKNTYQSVHMMPEPSQTAT